MGIMFRLFLAYDNRFGMMPRLIKNLRASNDPKHHRAADAVQEQLDERKRNPPKNMQALMQRALDTSRQVERDLRLEGRHGDAETLAGVIDYTEQNSSRNKKPNPKKPK